MLLVFGTKKLRNLGSDLGGAVKGFKDGMKEGSAPDQPAAPVPPAGQVTGTTHPSVDKTTIDVEARNKS